MKVPYINGRQVPLLLATKNGKPAKKATLLVRALDLINSIEPLICDDNGRACGKYTQVNPRQPCYTEKNRLCRDKAITGIIDTIQTNPSAFALRNVGVFINAESCFLQNRYDETGVAEIGLTDNTEHGVQNGLRTIATMLEFYHTECFDENGKLDINSEGYKCLAQVTLNVSIFTGVPKEELDAMSEALNTSVQVKQESIMNNKCRFDTIKNLLPDYMVNRIYWFEGDTGDDKNIHIKQLIQLLMLWHPTIWGGEHPLHCYTSKTKPLAEYDKQMENPDTERLMNAYLKAVIPSLMEMHDYIIAQYLLRYPDYKKNGQKQDGCNGFSKGTTTLNYGKDVETLDGTVWKSFVFPLLASLRATLKYDNKKNEFYFASKDLKKLIGSMDNEKSPLYKMANNIIENYYREGVIPEFIGRHPSIYQYCYDIVETKIS